LDLVESIGPRSRHPWEIVRAEFLIDLIRSQDVTRIIDVGAGDCYLGELIQRQLGKEVMFIDINFQDADLQKANRYRTIQEVTGRKGDLVLMADVLEHVPDPKSFLREIADKFPVQTPVVVTVPAFPTIFSIHDSSLGHFRRYTRKNLIEDCFPFISIQRIRYFFFFPLLVRWFQIKAGKHYPREINRWKHPGDSPITRIVSFVLKMDLKLSKRAGLSLLLIGKTK